MDEISMLMRMVPTERGNAVITLIQGSKEEIDYLLPSNIANIQNTAQNARGRAQETVDEFDLVKNMLEEIITGGKSKEN